MAEGEGLPDSRGGLWWSGVARGAGEASSLAPALSSLAGASPRSDPASGRCERRSSTGREQVESESGGQMEVSHPALEHYLYLSFYLHCAGDKRLRISDLLEATQGTC